MSLKACLELFYITCNYFHTRQLYKKNCKISIQFKIYTQIVIDLKRGNFYKKNHNQICPAYLL
jgi:hypothetical protein